MLRGPIGCGFISRGSVATVAYLSVAHLRVRGCVAKWPRG
jgi:hypothetical protein